MGRSEFIQDVFCAAVPDNLLDATDETIIAEFRLLAHMNVMRQYVGTPIAVLEFYSLDWMITTDPEELERFQPAHDCTGCREGNERAVQFLRDNPGKKLVMANINYMETM